MLIAKEYGITTTGTVETDMKTLLKFLILLYILFNSALSYADANLTTCLLGKYPVLCKHNQLSPSDAKKVNAAELRENLQLCLIGKYPILCKHDLLSSTEAARVNVAELRENLQTCLLGKYPVLCKHNLLSGNQVDLVQQAERREAVKAPLANRPSAKPLYAHSGGCESGHWVDSVSDDGEIVKLEDGSVWEVDVGDTVDSMLWLPTTDVLACPHKLINTEDNETVGATRLK